MAGHTCIMPLRPANAQTSQNGTSNEKKACWVPIIAVTFIIVGFLTPCR